MDMEAQTLQLTEFILPWVGILISFIIAIWVKDIATGLAKGIKFKIIRHEDKRNAFTQKILKYFKKD